MSCLILLLFLSSSVFAGDLTGFRGLSWGSLKTPEMSLQMQDSSYGGVDMCFRLGDDLHVGEVAVSAVFYSYWQNHLCSVDIIGEGYRNHLSLLSYLQRQYGRCFQPRPQIPSYVWDLPSGGIVLEYRAFPSSLYTCLLVSKRLMEEMESSESRP